MRLKSIACLTGLLCAASLARPSAVIAADKLPPGHPPVSSRAGIPGEAVFESDGDIAVAGGGSVSINATQPGQPARAAYLGVTTTSPDAALQKQLQLKPGVGLVVDNVEPNSPAEKAGVKQYDVLHKLDDQLLINAEQLAVLVRSYEPGKEVTLSIIREGKPQTLTAKLGQRAVQPLRLIFRTPTPAGGAATFNPLPHVYTLDATTGRNLNNAVVIASPDGKSQVAAALVTVDDGKHKLTISTVDGHKRMKGEDTSTGKIVFDLPIETKADLDKVPPEFHKLYQDVLLDNAPPTTTPTTTPAPTPLPAPQR